MAGVEVGDGLGVWVKVGVKVRVGTEGRTGVGVTGGGSNKSVSGVDKTTIEPSP